jgi:H+-translocating NAD(P) transhydrogenase subunit alpha
LELETGESEDRGGYARELGEEFYRKQRDLMARVVAESDVVITTAAIPGKPSPLLITQAAVEGMMLGSVIVDLAAERGGNCEPSQPDQRVVHQGIVVLGPTNLPSEVPFHASQMYSNNISRFLLNLVKQGQIAIDLQDPIVHETLVARDGDVPHPRIRQLAGMPELPPPEPEGGPPPPEPEGGTPPPAAVEAADTEPPATDPEPS